MPSVGFFPNVVNMALTLGLIYANIGFVGQCCASKIATNPTCIRVTGFLLDFFCKNFFYFFFFKNYSYKISINRNNYFPHIYHFIRQKNVQQKANTNPTKMVITL
jgi:hypothetical protein